MKVWFNFYIEKCDKCSKDHQLSIPYSSRRSALKARERQCNKYEFIGEPKEREFNISEWSSNEPVRCDDCPVPNESCLLCTDINR